MTSMQPCVRKVKEKHSIGRSAHVWKGFTVYVLTNVAFQLLLSKHHSVWAPDVATLDQPWCEFRAELYVCPANGKWCLCLLLNLHYYKNCTQMYTSKYFSQHCTYCI